MLVTTNRKQGGRGGVVTYDHLKNDLARYMRSDRNPEARFTTMLDLYRLPRDFPARSEIPTGTPGLAKVAALEAALKRDLPDSRFVPYIQLHEFEALLYCDLSQLSKHFSGGGSDVGFADLAREVAGMAPEDINEGDTTAPSKRIIKHVDIYKRSKVRVGAIAAAAIGLPSLRARCPHFDAWVSALEKLR